MSNEREQHGFYVIAATNTVERIFNTNLPPSRKPKFNKLYIYAGLNPGSGGALTANGASVWVGKDGDGPKITPDELSPGSVTLFELPQGQTMNVEDVLIYGTAGDGVFFSWWTP